MEIRVFCPTSRIRAHRSLLASVVVSCVLALQSPAGAAPRRVGIATKDITPTLPVPLSGYGAREKPFEAVDTPIFAKALAFEDENGQRALLITADLEGFQAVTVRAD